MYSDPMPRIDVLPTSSAAVPTPGYALVPDTRDLPPNPAQPVAGRKRAARRSGFEGGDTTVRQQNAVLKHLAELDRDSPRDVHIPVPHKQKDDVGRGEPGQPFIFLSHIVIGSGRKQSSNVRRILLSQKTFANHLADEEAALAQQAQHPATVPIRQTSDNRNEGISQTEKSTSTVNDPLEDEPLLKTYVPEAPSDELMEALTSAPPLSYNASRAELPRVTTPQRYFCEICGYWGTIKCIKCGARVCGLDCKTTHDDGRCLKFYS